MSVNFKVVGTGVPASKTEPKPQPETNKAKTKVKAKVKVNRRTYDLKDVTAVPLKRGVIMYCSKDLEEDFTKINTFDDVIALDKRKPNVIQGFSPDLYEAFFNNTTGALKRHCSVGDKVTVHRKYMAAKGDIPREVVYLYFKGLGDMTVVIAVLEDGDYELANRLIVYNDKN